MKTQLGNAFLILVSALALSACQTTSTAPSKELPQHENIRTTQAAIDPDSDGVLDDIDECPATPWKVIVDEVGCPIAGIGVGLKMEYRAFFAKGSSELSKEYQLELDKVAKKLQEYDTATMRIEGHASADEVDKKLRSNSLARNRAIIVKNYLIMQHQIDPNRLSTASYGAQRPIASSDTEEGRSMNRRVYGLAQEP
ncbi:flagellar motor protein MotB [Psychrobacter sp. C 20.9]|uniref:OmpA family protein n=1 Tax=Psychrobacter sp. C 20.9 TaxID=1926477 RepID=UPI000946A567|nr:OmpA family protein [Psychrobacter sp. C 20.9]OLF37283.1 flagellar motor protein MotB [Psychrobacter sp. C 20.9]